MKLQVRILPEAELDLVEARRWYDERRTGLGEEFLVCIKEALDRILLFPHGPAEIIPGIRRAVVRRFPYGIFYRIDVEQITIFAIYHSRRDPRGWQSRG